VSLEAADIQARLEAKFPGKILEAKLEAIDPFLVVDQRALLDMGRALRDDPELAFDTLHCLSAVDYLKEDRIEIVYHLSSLKHRHWIVVKVHLPRVDPKIPTVETIWPTANWHEREPATQRRRVLRPQRSAPHFPSDDWAGHPCARTGWRVARDRGEAGKQFAQRASEGETLGLVLSISPGKVVSKMSTARVYKDLEPDSAYAFKPEDLEDDEMILNMGPQHPSTHGVLRIELKTDGEIVKDARPHIGYLHRNFEKHAENIDYQGVIPFTDRMDYVGSMANSLTYAMVVEKLMAIEVGERVKSIRVLVSELQRIASHLLAIGTYGLDIGAFTPFLHCFREREKILDLFEWLCGARLLYNYNWVGGVSHDLPEGWTDKARQFLGEFSPVIEELDDLLSLNKIFTDRTATVGIISPELAVAYALSGPNLRGSGIKWDVRREAPYCGYEVRFRDPCRPGRYGRSVQVPEHETRR
jgi:Ni,Fe-hydrogenase III component G